jgi:hypothetical protein
MPEGFDSLLVKAVEPMLHGNVLRTVKSAIFVAVLIFTIPELI